MAAVSPALAHLATDPFMLECFDGPLDGEWRSCDPGEYLTLIGGEYRRGVKVLRRRSLQGRLTEVAQHALLWTAK